MDCSLLRPSRLSISASRMQGVGSSTGRRKWLLYKSGLVLGFSSISQQFTHPVCLLPPLSSCYRSPIVQLLLTRNDWTTTTTTMEGDKAPQSVGRSSAPFWIEKRQWCWRGYSYMFGLPSSSSSFFFPPPSPPECQRMSQSWSSSRWRRRRWRQRRCRCNWGGSRQVDDDGGGVAAVAGSGGVGGGSRVSGDGVSFPTSSSSEGVRSIRVSLRCSIQRFAESG